MIPKEKFLKKILVRFKLELKKYKHNTNTCNLMINNKYLNSKTPQNTGIIKLNCTNKIIKYKCR